MIKLCFFQEDQGIYMELVKQMIADKSKRLVVNVNDLRRKNPQRAKNLLENSFEEQIAFQRALKEYVSSIDPTYAKIQEEFFVAFSGSFGNKHVTPRSLTSRYLVLNPWIVLDFCKSLKCLNFHYNFILGI